MNPYKSHSFIHDKKSYTLSIYHDEHHSNPFTEWDSEPPLMYKYDRDVTHYGTDSIISNLLDLITDRRLTLSKKIILDAYDSKTEEEIREEKYDSQTFVDAIRDELKRDGDNIELIETLASIAKVPYLRFDSRGYSQWDYADALILLTPEFFTRTGCNPKDSDKILKQTKNLFDSWAWWDVYSFQLSEHIPLTRPDGTLSNETEDNLIDSCSWFYGDDGIESIKNHLPDFAKSTIDSLTYSV